ncbi:hypothetical protein MMC34_004796 [Xylographa carneopallida]|nr:hypothetical protein [Xylographa carneopallida]
MVSQPPKFVSIEPRSPKRDKLNCYNAGVAGTDGCTLAGISCYCRPPGSDEYLACVRGACDAADVQQFVADTV